MTILAIYHGVLQVGLWELCKNNFGNFDTIQCSGIIQE